MRLAAASAAATAVLSCVLAGGPPAPAAAASDVSAEQLGELAARAADDSTALAELRDVTSVEGVPYPVGRALEGADPDEARERVEALAAGVDQAIAEVDAAEAAEARLRAEELAGQAPELRVEEAEEAPSSGSGTTLGGPDLPLGVLIAIGAAIVIAVVLVSTRLGRRRVASVERAAGRPRRERGDPVARLQREADEAEAAGDHALAVRLRFQAGLLALATAGRIDLRPSDTPRGVARRLGVDRLTDLTGRFEEIVYGGRDAGPDDAADARSGWQAVLDGAGRA